MKKRGAVLLIEELEHLGVDVMFGIPGGMVIPFFDAIYDSKIRFILTRHEQGAAHMADGFSRATGRVGVCVATSGPGATNLVTGLATANFDSVPVVAITGQVKSSAIGNDAFQEVDITGITRPISKHNYLVRDVRDLARVVHEAFHIASTGRPGPVLIDVPTDVFTAECDTEGPGKVEMRLPGYKPRLDGNVRQIRLAAEAINAAARPIIYAGGGVIISGASDLLTQLARTTQIPVTTTLLGLGCFPETDPLALKMLGMHGTTYANYAVQQSDLIIAIGARFDDRVTGKVDTFAPHAKIIHVDVDPASISKSIRVDIPVVGDAKNILEELLKHVKPVDRSAWLAQVADWKQKHPLAYDRTCSDAIMPQFVIEQICEATKGEAVIVTEVGQHQMWAAHWFTHTKPRHFISSGGLGTMGFGFPAAIGAQIGRPEATVFDISGDGSFQMNIQELATAAANKVPVKVAILNNGYLGMVRQWQQLFYKKRYSATTLTGNPDFVKVAEAYGVKGLRATKPEEVRATIEKAIAHPGPVVIDFVVCPEENVFPMVPAGEAIDRMIGGMA